MCEHLESSDRCKEHGRENGGDLLKSNHRKDTSEISAPLTTALPVFICNIERVRPM